MKRHSLVLLLSLLSCCLHAQKALDMLTLKSGTVYKGTVVKMIPDSLYHLELAGRSIVVIPHADVKKVQRVKAKPYQVQYVYDPVDSHLVKHVPHSVYYHYRAHGYFARLHVLIGSLVGLHMIHGYKFGQFGYLGLGVGVHLAGALPAATAAGKVTGGYVPIYLHYEGDILKRKITPYYIIDAGYSFFPRGRREGPDPLYGSYFYSEVKGGPYGQVGFGAKFQGRKVYTSVGAICGLQYATYRRLERSIYSSGSVVMPLPSFDLAICF